jgi:bifunctional DNase/RNase
MHVEGVRRNFGISSVFMYTATLLDETERRMLNLGIERHEAIPIVAALNGLPLPRPPAIQLMADTLRLHGIALSSVRLEQFRSSPLFLFATTLQWRNRDGAETLERRDMTPGDLVGLALLMESPLVLSDELERYALRLSDGQTPETYLIDDFLKRQGVTLEEGQRPRLGFSKTPMRDALVKEIKVALAAKAPPFPEDGLEQRKQDYLALLLGGR